MARWETALTAVLAAAVMASALTLVEMRHLARAAYADLRGQELRRDRLQAQWRQLVLEERSLAGLGEIERLALARGMRRPDPQAVVLVPLAPAGMAHGR